MTYIDLGLLEIVDRPAQAFLCVRPRITVKHIQDVVAAFYGIRREHMQSRGRWWDISHPRQVAMYLARELTNMSLPELGRRFGGRDHTTVIHAIKAVKARRNESPKLKAELETLRARILA